MTQVDKEEFYEFLKDKEYKIVPGNWTHSNYYIDNNTGIRIAYKETSSYGAPDVYMIQD